MKKLLLFFMSIFSTFVSAQLNEGFESTTFPPTGWAVFDNANGSNLWIRNTTATLVYSGVASARINGQNVTDGTTAVDWLVTPQVLVPANGQLRFYGRKSQLGNFGSIYTIRVSTVSQTTPGDFATIQTWTETDFDYQNYQQKFVDLAAYAGQNVYIAFVMENDAGDRWLVDQVKVDQKCLTPTTLNVTAFSTSANLSWTSPNPVGPWEIEYGPQGFTPGTGTIVSAPTNPFTITGLSPLTSYSYYVRTICEADNVSPWSVVRNFTTTAAPPICGGNFIDSGGVTGNYANNENITTVICPTNSGELVTVTFTSFNTESGWDFLRIYDGNSTAGTLLGTYTGTTLPPTFTASTSNGCLTFNFTSDSSVVRSGWTANITCAPAPTCPRPSGVTLSGITQTTANVNWTENGPATQWQVLVLPANDPAPTGATPGWQTTSTRPYLYTGLTSGTQYKAYVRSICNPGVDESTVSTGTTFATLIQNDECINAVIAPVNSDTSCQLLANGTVLGATASSQGSTCGGTRDDDVWFQFTATSTTHYISLVNVAGSTTDLYHVVYSGSCGSLTQLYCSDPNSSVANALIPGQTYYVRIYTFTSTPNQTTTFNLCIGTPVNCTDASPFCGNTGLVYTNSTGAPSYGSIGCLGTSPNPAWYFMQVEQSGNLNLQIAQTSTATGAGIDVDFIAWGPFTAAQFNTMCNNLYDFPDGNTSIPNNVAACSYSFVSIENFTIANAVAGNYYLILITNFSNQPGTVTFTQTNIGASGAGTTNCDIVCDVSLGPDRIVCNQPTYTINASAIAADGYQWYFNNILIPGATSSSIVVNQSGDYKCIVTCGLNNVEDTINIQFIDQEVPTFIAPAPICSGAPAPVLPSTSNEGITGTWSPALVSNTASGTYTFTPTVGQCAATTTLFVEVLTTCAFNSFATAVWVDNCSTTGEGEFFNITGSGTSIIGPPANIFPNSNLGTYVQNSNQLIIRGAEVKTFKTLTANVCGATLNYRVYPVASTPGTFNSLVLPFFENCGAGTFPSGGPCNPGDQKWQEVLSDLESPINLTTYPPGNYVFEVYFTVVGDSNSTTDCDDSILVNNGGLNFIANFTIQNPPTFTFTQPTTCNGTEGSITISNLAPGETYSLTYNDDGNPVGPANYIADASGSFILLGLNAGVYDNFLFTINGCVTSNATQITLVNPVYTPTFTAIGPFCSGDAITLPLTSDEGYTGTWSPAVDNTQTVTYTFTPTPGQCVVGATLQVIVNPIPVLLSVTNNSPICLGSDAVFNIDGTPNATVSYTINGGASQTVVLDLNGDGTITIAAPTSNVDLQLTSISASGCSTALTNVSTVVVNPIPDVIVNNSLPVICSGDTTNISLTSSLAGTSFSWTIVSSNVNGASAGTGDLISQVLTTTSAVAGSVVYTITPSLNGCIGVPVTTTVTVNPLVSPVFDSIDPICENLTAPLLPLVSNNGITGAWSPSLIDTSLVGFTTYTFIPDAGQCASNQTLVVEIIDRTLPTFNSVEDLCLNSNDTSLPLTSLEGITGTWSPAIIDTSNTGVLIYTFTPSAEFCADQGFLTVNVITCAIPKGISPNGDGLNDTWDLSSYNIQKVEIFNRYGTKVYSKSSYENEWYGQSDNGNELPDGTYYFVIDFTDLETKTGWIYINRER
ncbi:gliding motility-associated C-terminal domain-containing protein [Flavobacterium lacisediminis]|uniref:Gliding motility-associated C-terminal domain-containing protein n=1 Tax=Flavobacterium lacisediminis TaxID=2989705 RepID=A0ABT3EKX8_9FLAO|nr:gliding motility-associated C-terminal domain-containing protein [Flavobacterium lacisediminis]MCW1149218.1 gliding motility-associated C-terminal domain-containing protein [Flavobacterium lacisediminis]